MPNAEVLSDAASDDSEPPEAVELWPESTAHVDNLGSSTSGLHSTEEHLLESDVLPPAPVTIITGCLGAGTILNGLSTAHFM